MSDSMKNMLKQQINSMVDLPTPSDNIMKIMLLFRSAEIDIPKLISLIEQNQSLVAQILKLINSSFYAIRNPVDSVGHAVTLLGVNRVKQVVYSASIMDMFSTEEQKEWKHSYSTSFLMTNLMKENALPAASNLPITMLLHDLGKVVLRRYSPRKYKMILMQAQKQKMPTFIQEQAILQATHAEAGAWLLERWQLPADIILPIHYHHSEEIPDEYVLETALVQFVNWVDCAAREIACPPPSDDLMIEAGFEEIDSDYWIAYQQDIIRKLEEIDDEEDENDEEAVRDTSTVKIKRTKS